MPSQIDDIALADAFLKRSAKLLPCQKEMMPYWHARGMSINAIARMFRCNKRTVQFVLFPERHALNIQHRKDRGGSAVYYDRNLQKEAVRNHRRYKADLDKTFILTPQHQSVMLINNVQQFVTDYLATAAWVTCDTGENQIFTKEARMAALNDCNEFASQVADKMGFDRAKEILNTPGSDLGYLAAHDLFLTRNGHGAGFWDKEDVYGEEEANILTKIAQAMGTADVVHVQGHKSRPLCFA